MEDEEYEEYLGSYIRLDFRDPLIYVKIGDSLRKRQKHSVAVEAYKKAIQIDPTCVSAYNGMCYAYLRIGYYSSALHYHEKAIQIDPDNPDS